jgi:hypothetical protein
VGDSSSTRHQKSNNSETHEETKFRDHDLTIIRG